MSISIKQIIHKKNIYAIIVKKNDQFKKKGVNFISRPILSSEGIAKVCFCFDPNNTRIELVEML